MEGVMMIVSQTPTITMTVLLMTVKSFKVGVKHFYYWSFEAHMYAQNS